jgi:hypothetical protein
MAFFIGWQFLYKQKRVADRNCIYQKIMKRNGKDVHKIRKIHNKYKIYTKYTELNK